MRWNQQHHHRGDPSCYSCLLAFAAITCSRILLLLLYHSFYYLPGMARRDPLTFSVGFVVCCSSLGCCCCCCLLSACHGLFLHCHSVTLSNSHAPPGPNTRTGYFAGASSILKQFCPYSYSTNTRKYVLYSTTCPNKYCNRRQT